MSSLLPLPVAIPLLGAGLLVAAGSRMSRRVHHLSALAVGLGSFGTSIPILLASERHDVLHWFGGWHPWGGVAVGIDFVAEPLGAGLAVLASGLLVAALAFSATYMRDDPRHYDVLMLIFGGGMCGFALTGDLFNMFVFFEVMGVAAYALSGFKVRELEPVQGSINFAITNTIGAYLMLIGIGLLYARTGALNLAQIGSALAGHGVDPLVAVALTLVMTGFLVKAAIVPFHFWLDDAHAVAPAPTCVLFSGAMVMLGLLAIARVWWTVFSGAYGDEALVPHVLLWLGLATAAIGAVMAFLQRHLKRLLAYSTISHAGVVLAGIAVLAPKGLAGAAVMVLGHGLLKASLFLAGGVLLQRFRAIDELKLRGRGRELRVLGGLFMLAAVGLIGLPYVGTFMGHSLIDDGATEAGQHLVGPILMITAGISAGAIMRAGARIFYGWGAAEDPLLSMEPDEEPDSREASLPVMVSVIGVLVVLGFVTSVVPGLQARAEQGASRFEERQAYASEVLHGAKPVPAPRPPYSVGSATAESVLFGLGAGAIAVITMAFGLWRSRLPRRFREAGTRALEPPLQVLRDAHSGIVGDYVTWLVLGTAGLAAVFALAAR